MSFNIPLPVAILIALAWVLAFFVFYLNLRKIDAFMTNFFNRPRRKIIGLSLMLLASIALLITYGITLYEYLINPSMVISSFLDGQYISGFLGDAIALPLLVLGFLIFFM